MGIPLLPLAPIASCSPSVSSKNWAPSAEGAQLTARQVPLPQALLIHHGLQPFWQDESGPSLVHRCASLSTYRTMISLHHPAHPKFCRDFPEPTDTIRSNNLRSGNEHLVLKNLYLFRDYVKSKPAEAAVPWVLLPLWPAPLTGG